MWPLQGVRRRARGAGTPFAAHGNIHIYIYMYTHTYVYILHVYVYMCAYIFMCMYMCVCVLAYSVACMVWIHTYIHSDRHAPIGEAGSRVVSALMGSMSLRVQRR